MEMGSLVGMSLKMLVLSTGCTVLGCCLLPSVCAKLILFHLLRTIPGKRG